MKGLILKDFINLKKNFKIFGIITLVYGFMAFTQKDASFFTYMFTMVFALLTISIYSYDEMAKWDYIALTMPITKKNIVQGKYLMMLLLTLIGGCFSFIFTVCINLFLNTASIVKGSNACFLGAAVAILFYSITIPIITKFGVEKSRFIFLAVYLLPFLIVYIISSVIQKLQIPKPEGLDRAVETVIQHAYIIVPIVVLVALFISYCISIRIYQKKEF